MFSRVFLLICGVAAWMLPVAQAQVPRPVTLASQQTSYIGVNIQEVTAERAKALKLREETGVEITRVEADSPADKAGIKSGDVVTDYNGQRVDGIEQFSRMVRETPAGREAKVGVIRNGMAQTIVVKVGVRKGNLLDGGAFTVVPFPQGGASIRIPDVPRSRMSWRNSSLGIEAESLDGQLAEFFGTKEGVLVRSVVKGSAADRAGMKAGDVIVRVGDSRVTSAADLSGHLNGGMVNFTLIRDRKEVTLSVGLDDDRRSGRGTRVEIDGEERF